MIMNLQMFADGDNTTPDITITQGKQLIYLFRRLNDASTKDGLNLAYTTENERSKSRDMDSTETKDGSVPTPGGMEHEVTATALLAYGQDGMTAEDLEAALDANDMFEIWEANLARPATASGKYKGRYMRGYLSEISTSSAADDNAELDLTWAIQGAGVTGDVTVPALIVEAVTYNFVDSPRQGA